MVNFTLVTVNVTTVNVTTVNVTTITVTSLNVLTVTVENATVDSTSEISDLDSSDMIIYQKLKEQQQQEDLIERYGLFYANATGEENIFELENDKLKNLSFDEYFGGVTMFSKTAFEKINGYSNLYWGWGFEDDDLLFRSKKENLLLDAQPPIIIPYTPKLTTPKMYKIPILILGLGFVLN